MVRAEGAVGGGQGGALTLRTDHGSRSLQGELLQLQTRAVGEAVRDLGLWPDLQGATGSEEKLPEHSEAKEKTKCQQDTTVM